MTRWLIICRNLRQRPLQSLLCAFVIAGSAAMIVLVLLLGNSVQQGLVKAAEPFDLIVGAKGSPNQLVLNTVFLQDVPIGNMDYDLVKELAADPAVEEAIPLGFGDNYRGYRMVGTQTALFAHKSKPSEPTWLRLREGRSFTKPMEAVLGAKAAAETELKCGDTFASSHGLVKGADQTAHQELFTVVGILEPLQGPYDGAVFVPLSDLWRMHAAHGDEAVRASATAILVKPKGYAEAYALYKKFQTRGDAQLIFPSQVVIRLFAMLGEGEKVLRVIGAVVFGMALLTIFATLYWSALSRARERAILRAIGASQRDILELLLGEGAVLVCFGTACGALAGHLFFALLASALAQKTALAVMGGFSLEEALLLLTIVLAGLAVGCVPAMLAAKRDIAGDL